MEGDDQESLFNYLQDFFQSFDDIDVEKVLGKSFKADEMQASTSTARGAAVDPYDEDKNCSTLLMYVREEAKKLMYQNMQEYENDSLDSDKDYYPTVRDKRTHDRKGRHKKCDHAPTRPSGGHARRHRSRKHKHAHELPKEPLTLVVEEESTPSIQVLHKKETNVPLDELPIHIPCPVEEVHQEEEKPQRNRRKSSIPRLRTLSASERATSKNSNTKTSVERAEVSTNLQYVYRSLEVNDSSKIPTLIQGRSKSQLRDSSKPRDRSNSPQLASAVQSPASPKPKKKKSPKPFERSRSRRRPKQYGHYPEDDDPKPAEKPADAEPKPVEKPADDEPKPVEKPADDEPKPVEKTADDEPKLVEKPAEEEPSTLIIEELATTEASSSVTVQTSTQAILEENPTRDSFHTMDSLQSFTTADTNFYNDANKVESGNISELSIIVVERNKDQILDYYADNQLYENLTGTLLSELEIKRVEGAGDFTADGPSTSSGDLLLSISEIAVTGWRKLGEEDGSEVSSESEIDAKTLKSILKQPDNDVLKYYKKLPPVWETPSESEVALTTISEEKLLTTSSEGCISVGPSEVSSAFYTCKDDPDSLSIHSRGPVVRSVASAFTIDDIEKRLLSRIAMIKRPGKITRLHEPHKPHRVAADVNLMRKIIEENENKSSKK